MAEKRSIINSVNIGPIPAGIWLVIIAILLILIPISGLWTGLLGVVSLAIGILIGLILLLALFGWI